MWRNKLILSLFLLLGLCAQASALTCVWTGGTATWDGSNTASWTSCGGGVPGSGDTATFDGTSGGGTVTVGNGYTVNVSSLDMLAFTGTLDFSAFNNNVNIGQSTLAATGFNNSGTATRTLKLGGGTFTVDATTTAWNMTTTTNLTFDKGTSTIVVTARASTKNLNLGAQTYNNITIGGTVGNTVSVGLNSTVVSGTFTLSGAGATVLGGNVSIATLTASGQASGAPHVLRSNAAGTARTITLTNNFTTGTWMGFEDITFSGGTNSASNSLDFGNNTNITITAPSVGGGGGGKIIGG